MNNRQRTSRGKTPGSGKVEPVLLWVGDAAAGTDVPDYPLVRYLQLFSGAGLGIKFLAAGFALERGVADALARLGVESLYGAWARDHWPEWMGDHARAIDYVVFDHPGHVGAFLSGVQQKTRAATIFYTNDGRADESACRACDVVLAGSRDAETELQERFPGMTVCCLPSAGLKPGADAEPLQPVMSQLESLLEASRDQALLRLAKSAAAVSTEPTPRLIAFYLPQYHPIPENDEWWGEGFTEWSNVRKTTPLFPGHYQPHEPADLGYYDLRDQKTRVAQAQLASKYGIEGFCYYHYWFEGKRLLERPLQDLLDSGKPDFPFCLCWANESWTRRWDGKEKDILMRQTYSHEDDLEHIRSLIPVFKDPRYIRVNGRPLFLVYRAENFPDPRKTAAIWREEARKAGLDGLYLCRVESFVKGAPEEFGFDASLEFAPDWWNKGPRLDGDSEEFRRADASLRQVCEDNYIHTYEGLSKAMLGKQVPAYKWWRCVTPSWDNWARRHRGASVFLGSTPGLYRDWLGACIDDAQLRLQGEERMVFINAWNEWAEGNHLEPDRKFGHGYLEATQQAMMDSRVASELRRLYAADERYMIRLSRRVQQLEKQLAKLQRQLDDLLHSTSWRVTAPIRWIKQKFLDRNS